MPDKKQSNSADVGLELDHELPPAEGGDSPNGGGPQNGGTATQPAASDAESELERVKAERAAYLDRAARIQAEFENYRKRQARDQQEFREYAVAEAIKSLLPILDSLDRALKTNAASLEDFRSGIELIDKQFHDALAKLGVEPFEAQGRPFDPNVHQAVQMVDTNEVKDNTVIDEFQRGYKLKDRLLRPAMVRVARNSKG
jgi:molecular chaperone GrpE